MHAEQQVKQRGWVKNAAIVFLSVMLVLTFFSNTILNRSLPEVATQVAQPGTITTRIRGNGNIEAAEVFEVKTTGSRKVESVLVKVGQTVAVGDVLVRLAAGSSDELLSAQDALDQAYYDYQIALITASQADENGDNPAVKLAREKLESTIAKRDGNKIDPATVAAAKATYQKLYTEYEAAQNNLTAAGGETSGGGGGGDYSAVTAAKAKWDEAKTSREAVLLQYGTAYNALKTHADTKKGTATLDAYMEYLATVYAETAKTAPTTASDVIKSGTEKYTVKEISDAYTAVTAALAAEAAAKTSYESAYNSYYSSFSKDNSYLMSLRDKAKQKADAAEKTYKDMETQQTAYEAAKQEVIDAQAALQTAVVNQKKETFDIQKYQRAVARAQQKVNSLAGGAGGEITSDVNGVVKAINVTAGNTADPSTAILTVEVPDRGYTVSISVTKEQAKRVTVGDAAEITTGYWGSSAINGKLVNIKTDPQKASTNKLLVFELSGEDIESGSQVSVSIGQKSQNYDIIVPSSAVRSDSNGSFVYVVAAKQSPLGNRYVATRVDVQVLAKDDTNTAISGGVAQYDYVITTSTKPIEKGMQVRMADN